MKTWTKRRVSCLGITTVLGFALAGSAAAQSEMDSDYGQKHGTVGYNDAGTFSLKPGLGFTASPTSFLLGFEGDYRVAEPISLGALTEVGIDDDVTIVSPVLFARYWPNLAEMIDADLAAIEPYAHLGVGFSYWDASGYRGVHDDDTEFLLNMGFGVEYRFNEHVSFGSQMLFNVIPAGMFDNSRINDKFYFSWEVVGLRYRF